MAKAKTTAPKATPPDAPIAADEFGRVSMEPGRVTSDRFAFDNGALKTFEHRGWSALEIVGRAGQMPAATCVVDLVACGLRTEAGQPVATRDAVARYGLPRLYGAALAALAWALQDLGLLAGTDTDAPDAPGEA